MLLAGLASCTGIRFAEPPNAAFASTEIVDVLEPDRVPAIERPEFDSVQVAVSEFGRTDPVVALLEGDQARAYPLRILVWHEVVNDRVAGRPVAVTYSPLSDSAAAFDRRSGDRVLTFASSGKLYRASLVLYDRETISLWPQLLAAASIGRLRGKTLEPVPVVVTSLGAFADAAPAGLVLSERTGFSRAYRATPYPNYERRPRPSRSFFLRPLDRRLPPMGRVVGVLAQSGPIAYPLAAVEKVRVVNDGAVALVWQPDVRSVLDAVEIGRARAAGGAAAFERAVAGRALTFHARPGGGIVDEETSTAWDLFGRGVAGRLAGSRLTPARSTQSFWFAWAAAYPSTVVWRLG